MASFCSVFYLDVQPATNHCRSIHEWGAKDEGETVWKINRRAPEYLEYLQKKYAAASEVDFRKPVRIEFINERGYDSKGLTREFFHTSQEALVCQDYKGKKLLVGERGHLIPNSFGEHLRDGFFLIGQLIAHAVANGCYGLCGLSPAVQKYLLNWSQMMSRNMEDWLEVTVDDVDDEQLRNLLKKVNFIIHFAERNRIHVLSVHFRAVCTNAG